MVDMLYVLVDARRSLSSREDFESFSFRQVVGATRGERVAVDSRMVDWGFPDSGLRETSLLERRRGPSVGGERPLEEEEELLGGLTGWVVRSLEPEFRRSGVRGPGGMGLFLEGGEWVGDLLIGMRGEGGEADIVGGAGMACILLTAYQSVEAIKSYS